MCIVLRRYRGPIKRVKDKLWVVRRLLDACIKTGLLKLSSCSSCIYLKHKHTTEKKKMFILCNIPINYCLK